MKIRSITSFYDPGVLDAGMIFDQLAKFSAEATRLFEIDGIAVESTRLSTIPFSMMVPTCCDQSAIFLAQKMEKNALSAGFSYLSFGPALPEEPKSYKMIPELLEGTKNTFFSAVIADSKNGIYLSAIKSAAKVMVRSAPLEPGGFANLRFSALASVPPFGPFFPASYHEKDQPASFSIAVECADVAVKAIQNATSLEEARNTLIDELNQSAERMSQVLRPLAKKYDLIFRGYDFSLAPFPEDSCSLGGSIESLGIKQIGNGGSLAGAAFLADALDRGTWQRAGFNGLMLPVLEDSVLAKRSLDQTLTIKDLLMYSAVCGTGLDTVPIAGDVEVGQVASLLLDVAALSVRLAKPLTARLMPIPGKKAGELTDFNFSYFANGRILDLPSQGLTGLFASKEIFSLSPRPVR